MDNPTPFDLNDAIHRWQQEVGASPAFCADNIEELGSHLRASAQRLKAAGLSEEESFLIASRRLGAVDKLSCEFGKMNAGLVWRTRAFWMLAGMLVYLTVSNLATLTSTGVMALCSHFMTNGFWLGWVGGGADALVIVGAGLFLRLVAAGRFTGITFSMGRLLQRKRIALLVMVFGLVMLRMATGAASLALYREISPATLGQTFAINFWLHSVGGYLMILFLVVALTRPFFSRHTTSVGFFMALLLFASGLTFLATGCGNAAKSRPSSGQTPVEQTMSSWETNQNAAVSRFLEIDWSQRPIFGSGNVLGYSEQEFMAIPTSARDAMSQQMLAELQTLKAICRSVNTRGNDALAKGDHVTAEKCFSQLKQCGEAFDGADSLAMLKLVGQAIKKKVKTNTRSP